MTDQERVEEIDVVHYEEDQEGNQFALLKEDDYWFLKEQAERAQELEIYQKGLKIEEKSHEKTRALNERYREALEKIKDNSSCVVAFGYAIKALEDSK